jgi:ribosome biogenesis GTPase / thiamine phosphate phosphatase
MPVGQIIKAISGFYYVRTSNQGVLPCRARGIFKFTKKKINPLVGDYVEYEMTGQGEGVVTWIQPRQTELVRPPIANVEQAVVVCSLREPDFQQMPVDRVLVHAERTGLAIKLCLTKQDLVAPESEWRQIASIRAIYERAKYPIRVTSIKTQVGVEELKQDLLGRISVFVGQSGVGKSSLLQQMLPGHLLETGSVSQKLGRGRHVTRTVELLALPDGGQVADTPGFSQLTFQGFQATELSHYFPEFAQYAEECRFRECLHQNEPGCVVKAAVAAEEIDRTRYGNYLRFLTEIKEQPWRYS